MEPSAGEVAILDIPLLVLPVSAKGSVVVEEGFVVAYTRTP
jgi:hypothetical protein